MRAACQNAKLMDLTDKPRIAIIGCGQIGRTRARNAAGCEIAVCCDSVLERARGLSAEFPGSVVETDWQRAVARPDVEIVVIATTHNLLAPIAAESARAGKHVLIEKPGATRADELEPVREAALRTGARVRVGFNHRYHRSLQKAREIVDSGAIGPLMFIRGRYGHGGRPGYEREWRANPELSGGGEALDQGVHLIDLARWFLGDFSEITGFTANYFWKMPVEDNAFFLLRTVEQKIAQLHATWTEWKNLFSLEIYGADGKLDISGKGGSYGVERIAFYKMLPQMGPPDTVIYEYPTPDDSWSREFAEFLTDIRQGREPSPGITDAQGALRVVETVY